MITDRAERGLPETPYDRRWGRASEILDGRANGHAIPSLKALSLRGHEPSRNLLSAVLLGGIGGKRGRALGLRLLRQMAAKDEPLARYNLAIEHLNRGDIKSYRYWLARVGPDDPDAAAELKRFEIRFEHEPMRRWRRLRPKRRNG